MTPDSKAARRAWLRALERVALLDRDPTLTLPTLLTNLAAEHPDRLALLGRDRTLTHADLASRIAAVAAWAAAHHKGGTIGLLARNSVDYAPLWLGLISAGYTVALLNHNLTGDALGHAARTAACTRVLAEPALADCLPDTIALELLADLPAGRLPPPPAQSDTALLIYTSGTTGPPKAARLSHRRILEWALWFAGMLDLQPGDRVYDPLPLYHSTGGVVAIGAALVAGASTYIAPAFSARTFWDDVADQDCSVLFYIGELCRYLNASPAHPKERSHRLRLATGNGMHASVWECFQSRFAIPQILEFYAATEGSLSLYNAEGKPGAIGRIPPFLHSRFPLSLIRIDPETLETIRGPDGLCQSCTPGEPGEALGRRPFDGYTDPAATDRKLLHDVLAPGDTWFRTGDLMRQDDAGFLYFVDRLGDTFRWKGENVATSDVAAALRACPGVQDALVYGVRVPGHEGRAGMAAIVPGQNFDLATLQTHIAACLPAYAQPLFFRLCPTLELTGTLKLTPTRLANEGFAASPDPVHFHDRPNARIVPCDETVRAELETGRRKL